MIPHVHAGGEMAPTDWPKTGRCIDWMTEVGEWFGGAATWHFGIGKDHGKARETGWWRDEATGFKGSLRDSLSG